MPPRRQNLPRNSQNTQELQSRGMRRTKLALFIKQVEKEGKSLKKKKNEQEWSLRRPRGAHGVFTTLFQHRNA